ncbi:MAG: hypothetical protein JWN41_151 [Thermoleophilia bacterium]|nr:hypothetical protein [Thermoleophilia bacterium]
MPHPFENRGSWSAAHAAAMVGADPARRVVQHVEGPTLLDRELPFGRGIATLDRAPTCLGRSSPAFALVSEPGRSNRRHLLRRGLGATLTTIVLALVATGCGGAADATTATPAPAPAATPTPAVADSGSTGTTVADGTAGAASASTDTTTPGAASSSSDIPGANEIAGSEAAGGAAIKISTLTPQEFVRAHCTKPIVVVLHQPNSILDQALLSSVKAALGSASRTAKHDTVLLVYTPKEIKRFGDLPAKVGLLTAPGVAVINRGGAIQNFWTGYVDSSLLGRVLELAAATKPCKVANEDAGVSAADPTLGAAATSSSLAAAATIASGGAATAATTTPAPGAGGDIDSEQGNAALKLLN